MSMINHILCPVDFKEPSYDALTFANDLAVHFGAKITLLHVVEPVPLPAAPVQAAAFNVADYARHLLENNSETLKKIIDKHVDKELDSEGKVLEGNAGDSIVRFAEECGADLIVLSTHGGTALGHLVFGSVTDKVMRRSTKPVLTIPVSGK